MDHLGHEVQCPEGFSKNLHRHISRSSKMKKSKFKGKRLIFLENGRNFQTNLSQEIFKENLNKSN